MTESGPEPAGGRVEAWRYRSRLNGHKACTIITNRVSGPPLGGGSGPLGPSAALRGPSSGKGVDATRFARAGTAESVFDDSLIPYASGPSDYPSEAREKEGWRYKEIRKRV